VPCIRRRAAASWDIGVALSVLAVDEDDEPLEVPELDEELDEVFVPEEVVEPVDVVVPEEVVEPVDVVVPEEEVEPEEVVVSEELLEPEVLVLPEELVLPLDVLPTVVAALEVSELSPDSLPHAARVAVMTIPKQTAIIFTLIIPFRLFRRYECDS